VGNLHIGVLKFVLMKLKQGKMIRKDGYSLPIFMFKMGQKIKQSQFNVINR
jgi:hypothetical protein